MGNISDILHPRSGIFLRYFLAVHNEPFHVPNGQQRLAESYDVLRKMVAKADRYGMRLTLMFSPPWADFILADEEPTINRKKFIAFCEELIARGLPDKVQWGINTRVTDIMRDVDYLPLYRKAGLVHVSLGTEAAAQMKLDLFNKETKVEQNKRAIQLLREADIFTEAQFIVGLDNETPETLEETYQMAWDWQPDLANWAMYTPWPFTPLFRELGDKVEVFDFEKYNFVTPIMKPKSMDRAELLDRVMHNYRRFYMRKALFHYPWRGTGFRRRYLLGCLFAFLKAGVGRTFYDLGKAGYWGPQTKNTVDFHFDEDRAIAPAQMADWEAMKQKA